MNYHDERFSKCKKRRSLISKTPAFRTLWYSILGLRPFLNEKGRRTSGHQDQQNGAQIFGEMIRKKASVHLQVPSNFKKGAGFKGCQKREQRGSNPSSCPKTALGIYRIF
jgi:hypothetical protein